MSTKLLAGSAILCLLATAPVYAHPYQDNKQQETAPSAPDKTEKPADKPAKQPANKPVDKPAKTPKNQPKTDAPRQENDQQQQKADEKAQQNEAKTQQKQAKEQQKQNEKTNKQEVKQQGDQDRNRAPVQSADNGRRIPEDRYRADFGREHTFHFHHENDGRFQFGGFWFQYTDAWPSDWTDGDDFYVVEDGGVDYLCDARFPDQRIVVVVVS
jgi:hypothetical protein